MLQPTFDPKTTLQTIACERITCWATAPAMLERILDLPPGLPLPYDTSSLRTVAVSGSALPAALASSFMDEYGDILYNLYGTTEAGWVTVACPGDLRRAPGTASRAARHAIVRVLDEDGVAVRAGDSGRIFAGTALLREGCRGEGIEMFDGLMATGDVGHFDDHGRLLVER